MTEHAGNSGQPSAAHDAPTSELVKQLSEQVSVLVRDELKLAQMEMSRKGKQARVGVGILGVSGLVALYAAGCLLACGILAIAGVVAAWLAALIVGVALLLVSGAAAVLGRGRLQKATPPVPEQAVGSVKADVEEIKERARP